MQLHERLILTDCDGVILDWNARFHAWMLSRGYTMAPKGDEQYRIGIRYGISYEEGKSLVREFNNSSAIAFLPAYKDSIYYMDLLWRKHGYKFAVITSISLDQFTQKLRKYNLYELFDKNMFESIVCLDTGSDKDEALEQYRDTGCYWIEDSINNAKTGRDLGLQSFLMEHSHNRTRCPDGVTMVDSWKDIYQRITGYF